MKEKIFNAFRIVVLAFILSSAIGYSLADWSPPSGTPPFNNVPPPINVGPTTQVKDGNLFVKRFWAQKAQSLSTVGAPGCSPVSATCDSDDTLVTKDYLDAMLAGMGGGGIARKKMFTTVGTTIWTVPTGVTTVWVSMAGGGGGGRSFNASNSADGTAGGSSKFGTALIMGGGGGGNTGSMRGVGGVAIGGGIDGDVKGGSFFGSTCVGGHNVAYRSYDGCGYGGGGGASFGNHVMGQGGNAASAMNEELTVMPGTSYEIVVGAGGVSRKDYLVIGGDGSDGFVLVEW